MSDYFASRMVDAATWLSALESRMTFVDGSRGAHDLLAKRCVMSRALTTFLRGRVYFGPPADNGPEAVCDGKSVRCEWVVCAVDGVA